MSSLDHARARAADLAVARPGWLVLWSPWRGVFTAFECRSPDACAIVEAPTIDQLAEAMTLVEVELCQAHPMPLAYIPAMGPGLPG